MFLYVTESETHFTLLFYDDYAMQESLVFQWPNGCSKFFTTSAKELISDNFMHASLGSPPDVKHLSSIFITCCNVLRIQYVAEKQCYEFHFPMR